MSWIHLDDLLRIIELALADESVKGAVNAVAPEPVRQREFQRALTRAAASAVVAARARCRAAGSRSAKWRSYWCVASA